MTESVITILARNLFALESKALRDTAQWPELTESRMELIDSICREYLPSGSGFDCGTTLDLDKSNSNKLVFVTSFHHMDDGGGYCGWTDHCVTVKPSLVFGFDLRVSGKDRNGIKDYIAQMFYDALGRKLEISFDKASNSYTVKESIA